MEWRVLLWSTRLFVCRESNVWHNVTDVENCTYIVHKTSIGNLGLYTINTGFTARVAPRAPKKSTQSPAEQQVAVRQS